MKTNTKSKRKPPERIWVGGFTGYTYGGFHKLKPLHPLSKEEMATWHEYRLVKPKKTPKASRTCVAK